jgi:hypothetical protein
MMPALVRATVVLWKVTGEGDKRAVIFEKTAQTSFFTEGGPVDEREVIRQYILHLKVEEQPALAQAWLNGLLRAYDIQPTALTRPNLPLPVLPS